MFPLRTIMVIGAAVMLLPSEKENQQKLLNAALTNVEWASTYCEREPATCARAGAAWSGFVEKAQFGATLIGEMVTKGSEASRRQGGLVDASAPVGTLEEQDLIPDWQGDTGTEG
jgi:hypothetical protein